MKKRGFTLLELVVVMIIMGILATLGFSQYTRVIERSRGAEARQVLGNLRTQAAGLFMERQSGGLMPAGIINNNSVGIGLTDGLIPETCTADDNDQYYFSYGITQPDGYRFIATATRCTVSGKPPVSSYPGTLILESNLSNGSDVWSGSGGY